MGSLRHLGEESSPERSERSVIRWVLNLGFSIVTRRGGKRGFLRITKDKEDVLIFLRPKGTFTMYYAKTRNPEWKDKDRGQGPIERIEFERVLRDVLERGRSSTRKKENVSRQD
jgi:hypothetical protein